MMGWDRTEERQPTVRRPRGRQRDCRTERGQASASF
jgi:hypothetical protein